MPRVGEEKVWVEAEQEKGGNTILTLVDVRARRELVKRLGKHNAKVRVDKIKNFPPHLVDELNAGYPVRFKMFQSAFEKMLGDSNGVSGFGALPYRWVITKDYINDGEDKGVSGPRGADPEIKTNRQHFVMKDDDGEVYYEGEIYGDYIGFEPLDDFGEPNAGATSIWYKGKAL